MQETIDAKRILFPVQLHDGVLGHAAARRLDNAGYGFHPMTDEVDDAARTQVGAASVVPAPGSNAVEVLGDRGSPCEYVFDVVVMGDVAFHRGIDCRAGRVCLRALLQHVGAAHWRHWVPTCGGSVR